MNRGINRQWILQDNVDKQFFVDLLIRFRKGYALNVYHWAVMANHFHLAIETLSVGDLSGYVGKVTRRFSTYHHRRHGGSGPVWERRFKSVLVQKEGYLNRLGRYVERNGLRAGAVNTAPWDYRFCSAAAYVQGRGDGLVDPAAHPTWTDISVHRQAERKSYRLFLSKTDEAVEDESLFRGSRSVIGDESFRINTRQVTGRRTSRGRGRKRIRVQ